MKMNNMLVLGLGVVFSTSVLSASAQVYKWVDERGVTQYSDTPPRNDNQSEVLDIATTGYESSAPTGACQTIRCQYERLRNDRLEDEKQAQINAQSRASVVTLQPPASPLSPRTTFTYGPRWVDYGRFGVYGRGFPAPIQPFPSQQPHSAGSSALGW